MERLERLPELLRSGLTKGEIARELGCSRSTLYRDVETLDAQDSAALGPAPESLPELYEESIKLLREAAYRGSATAASKLAELAARRMDEQGCANHVDASEAVQGVLFVWQLMRDAFRDWPRKVGVEHGWYGEQVARIEDSIMDELERLRRIIHAWRGDDGALDEESDEDLRATLAFVQQRLEEELAERSEYWVTRLN